MEINWDKIRVSSHHAMEIAGLDRLRFNEAVNAGSYPCAPQGQRGKTRMFEGEEQMICLFLFARLLDDGVKHERAGAIACGLLQFFEEHKVDGGSYQGNTVVRVKGQSSIAFFVDGAKFDPEFNRKDKVYIGAGLNLLSTVIDVANMRVIIRAKFTELMEAQRHTLGAEDEEVSG